MEKLYSYHIFYFPFKWKNLEVKSDLFTKQTDLDKIVIDKYSNWLRNPGALNDRESDEFYNEKNYYYPFVHHVLYDTQQEETLVHHYERKEPHNSTVLYQIEINERTYELKIDSLTLNLYATGVGTLVFYLKNEKENQNSANDILLINQYGRRIFPPFIADLERRDEISRSLTIEGLLGEPSKYREDFQGYNNQKDWQPASFIKNLINDLAPKLSVLPVVDDRMFVNCWYGNTELSRVAIGDYKYFIEKEQNNWWYRFVFVDKLWSTCQNEVMMAKLVEKCTYSRWQGYGTLYGISRYSFVALTDPDSWEGKELIPTHIATIYSRMIELVLVQRASILKFSEEVTKVSKLSKDEKNGMYIIKHITSLYQEYIQFVNQVHFREVTAQEQGIELYKMMLKTLDIEDQIKDLDNELEELHEYASFVRDRERNSKADMLNLVAAIFLPATLFAGIFGMNSIDKGELLPSFCIQIGIVISATIIMYLIIKFINKKK